MSKVIKSTAQDVGKIYASLHAFFCLFLLSVPFSDPSPLEMQFCRKFLLLFVLVWEFQNHLVDKTMVEKKGCSGGWSTPKYYGN